MPAFEVYLKSADGGTEPEARVVSARYLVATGADYVFTDRGTSEGPDPTEPVAVFPRTEVRLIRRRDAAGD